MRRDAFVPLRTVQAQYSLLPVIVTVNHQIIVILPYLWFRTYAYSYQLLINK